MEIDLTWIIAIIAIIAAFVIGLKLRPRPRAYIRIENESGSITTQLDDPEAHLDYVRSRIRSVVQAVQEKPDDPPRELVGAVSLTAGFNELTLDIQSANVEVKHDETAQVVTWATTYPDHFTGENGVIEQTDYRRTILDVNRDRLLVTVPANFEGGLTLKVAQASSVTVDLWLHGDITIESEGSGEISFGNLTAINALDVTSNTDAEITFGDIDGQSANFKLASSGNVTTGKVTLTGNFDAELTDDGSLTTGDIKAARVDLDSSDDGDINTGHIESGSLVNVDTGDGETSSLNAEITIESIGAHGDVDIDAGGDRKITINGDMVAEGGAVKLTTRLDGGISTGNIKSQSVTIDAKDDGDITTGEIESASTVNVDTGDGETSSLNAEITIESIWAGADIDLDAGGDYPITVNGEVTSEKGEVELTTRLDGKLTTGDIKARSVKIKTYDDGDIVTGKIESDTKVDIDTGSDDLDDGMNAEVTTDGITAGTEVEIDVGGDYPVNVNGDIVVHDGGSVEITTRLDGGAKCGDITAGAVKIRTYDDGSVTTGRIGSNSKVEIETGSDDVDDGRKADVTVDSIAAGTLVDIDVGGDGTVTINGYVHVENGSFTVHTRLDGPASVGDVRATTIELEVEDDGGITLGDVTGDSVTTEQTGDGDVALGELKCRTFVGKVKDDGDLTIGATHVDGKFTGSATDCGDITVASCVAAELKLDADETGTIYINGGSAPKVFVSGDVQLAESFEDVWEKR